MKYGMNLLLWTGELNDSLLPILDKLKKFGFDGVELPMFNLDLDYALGVSASTMRDWRERPSRCATSKTTRSVPMRRAGEGVELNKKTLDCCAAVGAETLVGPYHSALGHFSGAGPTKDEWKWGVESMRAVAEHAGKVKVKLGVEALNRFECYFLNAHADAARFAREVNHPACGIMYDTFHSNIEEKSIPKTFKEIKDVLCHIHISENDRSTPGKGNVRWRKNFDSIVEIGYDGWLVIEAFGLALPELAAATRIWRRMFDDELTLAKEGLEFMKSEIAARKK